MTNFKEDIRLEEAHAKPVAEVIHRLGIEGLKRISGEFIGPCPLCGGRDRFGININSKAFLCRKCDIRGGDMVSLVQACQVLDFKGALTWLCGKERAEIDPEERARRRKAAEKAEANQALYAARARNFAIRQGREIFARGEYQNTGLVRDYLSKRGIKPHLLPNIPKDLLFLPNHPYVKKVGGDQVEMHRGPAMLAGIRDAKGKGRAVHQTWLDLSRDNGKALITHDGETYSSKLVRGSKKGGAIRLASPKGFKTLIMAEGIENTLTAMAANAVPGAAYWAGVDLGNMGGKMLRGKGLKFAGQPDMEDGEAFVPPPQIDRLIFIQDGDSEPRMTRAKLLSGLRRARAHIPGLRCQIVPVPTGFDLNDMLAGKDGGARHD